MDTQTLESIRRARQGIVRNPADALEVKWRRLRERLFGVDCSIFDKTIAWYREAHGEQVSRAEALARALDKARHKDAWFQSDRTTIEDEAHFYQEVGIYPFRQPYLKRFGGFRYMRNFVRHLEHPSILEYGCGSAALTEYLLDKFPECEFSVADIPSVTLDFVTWKQAHYGYPYSILTIDPGGAPPLRRSYGLIICTDVLEHTPNPLQIVQSFVEHLSPRGVLVVDFLSNPGGENLVEAYEQREAVKALLRENLFVVNPIDGPQGARGLYVKGVS